MSLFDYRGSAGSTAPSDIPSLLDSFGVTWYGGFQRGLGMYSVSTDQLTPVTSSGQSVGQWVPTWTAGGFSAKFVQTSNSKRPSYMNWYGTMGIMGDATTTWLNLDSTTALNRDHTVLIATAAPADSGFVYSHAVSRMRFSLPAAASANATFYSNNAAGMTANGVLSTTNISSTTARYRAGWSSAGNSFYNNAPNLLRSSGSTNYTEASVTEVWLIGGILTPNQIAQCIPYLAI